MMTTFFLLLDAAHALAPAALKNTMLQKSLFTSATEQG
jgi:hypothetical protein